jgi:hypothetical protein
LARLARRADRAGPVLVLFVVLSQFAVSQAAWQCPRQNAGIVVGEVSF